MHEIDTYKYNSRCIRELYLPRLGPSSLFSVPTSTARIWGGGTDQAIGICRLGWVDRKLGVAYPLFSFFHKLHYKHSLDTYIYNFRCVQEPSPARLGPSGSFSYQRAQRAFPTHLPHLNYSLDARKNQGIAGPLFSLLIKYIGSIS